MRDIALSLLLLGLLPVSLWRPWIGVLVYLWLSFMNPHRLTWGFAFSQPWAFMVALATIAGLALTRDRKRIPWNAPLTLMICCFFYFTFTTFFAQAQDQAWPAWNRFAKIILLTSLVPMVIYGADRIKLTIMVTALSIGFFGFKGGIFTLTTGGTAMVRGPDSSFIADNNSLGLALVIVVPLLHWLATQERRTWLRRFYLATMWLTMISSVFTYSRGAMLGLATVSSLIFFKARSKFFVLLLLVPLVFLGKSLVPEQLYSRAQSIEDYRQDSSAMLRLQAWGVAWNVAKDHPLTGGGFSFDYVPDNVWLSYAPFMVEFAANYARAAHSIYFQVLGEHGFIGFALFMGMLMSTIMALRRIAAQARLASETKWIGTLSTALLISVIGYMVSGAFLSLAYFDLPYLLIVLSAVLRRELDARKVAPDAGVTRGMPGPRPGARPITVGSPGLAVSRAKGPLRNS